MIFQPPSPRSHFRIFINILESWVVDYLDTDSRIDRWDLDKILAMFLSCSCCMLPDYRIPLASLAWLLPSFIHRHSPCWSNHLGTLSRPQSNQATKRPLIVGGRSSLTRWLAIFSLAADSNQGVCSRMRCLPPPMPRSHRFLLVPCLAIYSSAAFSANPNHSDAPCRKINPNALMNHRFHCSRVSKSTIALPSYLRIDHPVSLTTHSNLSRCFQCSISISLLLCFKIKYSTASTSQNEKFRCLQFSNQQLPYHRVLRSTISLPSYLSVTHPAAHRTSVTHSRTPKYAIYTLILTPIYEIYTCLWKFYTKSKTSPNLASCFASSFVASLSLIDAFRFGRIWFQQSMGSWSP